MSMKILQINRCKSYFEVHTEDAVYELSGECLKQYSLAEGADADETLLRTLHDESRFRRGYRRACHLLDERDYSYMMLYRKLMQTYRDKTLCLKITDKLAEDGYIDDRRYAEKLAEYLVERKRYGIFRAKQEMLRRGLDKRLADEFLEELEDAAEENIPAVLEKKYGRILTDPDDRKTREKVIAGMIRLGYSYKSVKYAIEDYFADWEDDEEDEYEEE